MKCVLCRFLVLMIVKITNEKKMNSEEIEKAKGKNF